MASASTVSYEPGCGKYAGATQHALDNAPRSVAWHMLSPFSKVRLSINSASAAFPHSIRRTRVYLLSCTRSPWQSTRLDQATNIAHYPGKCQIGRASCRERVLQFV